MCCSFLFQAPFTGQRDAAGLCTEIEDGPTTRRPISRSQQSARPSHSKPPRLCWPLRALLFAHGVLVLPASAYTAHPSDPLPPPHSGVRTPERRRTQDDEEAPRTGQDRTGQRQRPRLQLRPASPLPLLCVVRLRAQARRLRLQPLVRRRMPRLVPPRPSVAPFPAHTTACSKPPAIASLVALYYSCGPRPSARAANSIAQLMLVH